MIDKLTVQRIMDAADIVEVVSDYVHLIRRGANYVGLCPFHNERTPSFSVNKARNFCYCFSCHKGGSPVNFIMQKEGISYHEAMLQLARKYGIKVEEKKLTDAERLVQNKRESMFVANDWAMRHFEKNLHDTEEGRNVGLQYFYQRGVTEEAIRQFHLGYALDRSGEFREAALKAGYSLDVLRELGLVGTSQKGMDYDRFRGRIIFPILNSSSKVIAFGGRDLKGGPAKYVNSPESDIYKKSNELYGLFQARQTIVKDDRVFLVEGYMDVIGMWQSGMKNVVASSGTALTDGQINLLHRFTNNITLIYDGDAAGIKASLRGINMLLSHNLNVKVLLLPDGDDPDSFARKHTPEEFKTYVAEHETDIIRFKIDVLTQNYDINDPAQRVEVIKSVVESIAHIPDKITREIYIQECGKLLDIPDETIAEEVRKMRGPVMERLRRERELQRLRNEEGNGQQPSQPSRPATPQASAPSPAPPPQTLQALLTPVQHPAKRAPFRKAVALPLQPLERNLLRYCIKYGFIPFCEGVDGNGNDCYFTLYEFVEDDLNADDICFSVEAYGKVFAELKRILPDFKTSEKDNNLKIESGLDEMRRQGYDDIASKSLSMHEIALEEKKLEEKIAERRKLLQLEHAKAYPAMILASHPDDDIRATVTSLISERHQLSNIYLKQGTQTKEEDRLEQLIPRALTELKSEILDQKLKSLLAEFKDKVGKVSEEEEKELFAQINSVIQIRSEVARVIGERILSPHRKG